MVVLPVTSRFRAQNVPGSDFDCHSADLAGEGGSADESDSADGSDEGDKVHEMLSGQIARQSQPRT